MTRYNQIPAVIIILVTSFCWLNFTPNAFNSNDEWFDAYGIVFWETEKLHLDNFGIYLQRNPDMIGYMGFYVGESDDPTELSGRMKRAKDYLVCDLNIELSRIIVINGGKRSETKIVLHPVAKSKPIPDFEY